MSLSKNEKGGANTDVQPVESEAAATPLEPTLEPLRVFRDKAYMSRTLIMPDGRGLNVRGGQVCAFGDDQFAFLSAHPDLERLVE